MKDEANDPAFYFGGEVRRERLAVRMSLATLGRKSATTPARYLALNGASGPPLRSSPRDVIRRFPAEPAGSTASTWRAGSGRQPRRGCVTGSRSTSGARSACGSGSRPRSPDCCKPKRSRSRCCGPSTARQASRSSRALSARMSRKVILTRDKAATADVRFLVDEAALRRKTGSTLTMADQPDHLLTLATLPNVTIQVVPQRRARRPYRRLRHRGKAQGHRRGVH